VSFSDKEDILALLWESGLIQVWDLKTKISPRPGKAMEPVQLWEGPINDEQSLSFRRITVSSTGVGTLSLAALGSSSSGPDVLVMADINDGDLQGRKVVNLPGRNGDLVLNDLCSWKNLDGELFRGGCLLLRFASGESDLFHS
jgi:elongator complex protein 1